HLRIGIARTGRTARSIQVWYGVPDPPDSSACGVPSTRACSATTCVGARGVSPLERTAWDGGSVLAQGRRVAALRGRGRLLVPMGKLAYLFPAFPVFHQTFVLWEVLGLQRNGVQPTIYSLRPGGPRQQPEGRALAGAVHCLPSIFSMAVWRANGRLLRR